MNRVFPFLLSMTFFCVGCENVLNGFSLFINNLSSLHRDIAYHFRLILCTIDDRNFRSTKPVCLFTSLFHGCFVFLFISLWYFSLSAALFSFIETGELNLRVTHIPIHKIHTISSLQICCCCYCCFYWLKTQFGTRNK